MRAEVSVYDEIDKATDLGNATRANTFANSFSIRLEVITVLTRKRIGARLPAIIGTYRNRFAGLGCCLKARQSTRTIDRGVILFPKLI